MICGTRIANSTIRRKEDDAGNSYSDNTSPTIEAAESAKQIILFRLVQRGWFISPT
jgi:hypothetical protein